MSRACDQKAPLTPQHPGLRGSKAASLTGDRTLTGGEDGRGSQREAGEIPGAGGGLSEDRVEVQVGRQVIASHSLSEAYGTLGIPGLNRGGA